MAEREDNVYKAKLAEQAERYDGERRLVPSQKRSSPFLAYNVRPICHLASARRNCSVLDFATNR